MTSLSARLLHDKVASVCPIVGLAIGDPADRSTWRIDFSPSATSTQISDANALIASLTLPLKPTVLPALEFWNRFTTAEQLAAASNPQLNVFVVTALAYGSVDLSNSQTKQGLDAAVQAGAITSARETAILTP